jgi:hypothetical protein
MILWEIKAQALRLMFADTDVEFNENEFTTGTIYTNANTREKLVRMNDSISRAIDLFYQYNGETSQWVEKALVSTTSGGITTYYNRLDVSADPSNMGFPTRIDVIEDLDNLIKYTQNVQYTYNQIDRKIYFLNADYRDFGEHIRFRVYYKMNRINLPSAPNEMTYNVSTSLGIPEEVQRQIPLYVKSELFQEDEPQIAQQAKADFIQFLILNQRKNFSNVQTKVRRTFKRRYDV